MLNVGTLQDPRELFDLIEIVGTGTYGEVYKVNPALSMATAVEKTALSV